MSNSTQPKNKGVLRRLGRHLRDFFISRFPLRLSSVSGFALYIRDRSQLELYQGIFVKDEFRVVRFPEEMKFEAPVVFDVGANCGFFSLRILDQYPAATVYSFEPQERLVREFQEVIEENNLQGRVRAFHCALGKEDGTAVLYQNRSPISASMVEAKAGKRSIISRLPVTVKSLNSAFKELALEKIDILKIDVEGAELDVLAGADEILGRVDYLLIETHKPFSEPEQVAALVAKFDLVRFPALEKGNNVDLVFARKNLILVA